MCTIPSVGSATLRTKSANIDPTSTLKTSFARNVPCMITVGRWDAFATAGDTQNGQNTVMLKLQPFQVRSCPASFRRSGSASCIAISDCLSSTPFGLWDPQRSPKRPTVIPETPPGRQITTIRPQKVFYGVSPHRADFVPSLMTKTRGRYARYPS